MNDKALHTLEYVKIIEMLESRAVSPMGKEMAAALRPMTDIGDIRMAQRETSEAAGFILRKGSLPLGGIRDIRQSLRHAAVGGTLSIEELMHVCDFLYVCGKVITYGKTPPEETSRLAPYFSGIHPAEGLENEINRCVSGPQELSDSASQKLAEIRRGVRQANDRVREHLNSVIHSASYKTMLQDPIVTIRNERFCVPVKAEYRANFPGMVHDQSSTGATVFIEPMSVVQLNNKIKELHFEEKKEIERILQKLSGMVAQHGDILSANNEVLVFLDFVFAKGELALAMKASEPDFNDRGYIHIKKGRHPLLSNDTVVPTDIWLGGEFSMLLITGPNTGGKTVSLKTLGLFTCMGQAGLHIPAFDHSELSVFEDVFADIGDEQSIEQSLSTFSSHMSNIVRILEQVNDRSLVLLDELGAGTDPTEGAALAVAILQELQTYKIRAAVTTHYSELKLFALATEGVENASCEFDVETLRPTYKLLIGIPGKSNAFAIASRLGLPDGVISRAKDVLSHEDVRFEDMITDLEISKKSVLIEQERAETFRREAEVLKKEFENQKDALKAQKEKILREAKDEALQAVRKAQEDAEEAIREFKRQMRENAGQRELDDARRQMKERLAGMEDGLASASGAPKVKRALPRPLRRGDRVFIHSLNQTGIISSPPDASGSAVIQAGIMKIEVNISDLSLDDSEEKEKMRQYAAASTPRAGKSLNIAREIDLRGCTTEEALERADKYLDDAFLSGLSTVTVIHGKGTGALRGAIQNLLKKHPHVKEYRLGKYGEGEDGVSIAEMKN
ncbi:MAG: endonuclease MutS2 [Clostridiales bacterium]|jgi:DNA mismatch repair protein MutS2|nr:endonuclease MutS2 [Clostridiales bacterium]